MSGANYSFCPGCGQKAMYVGEADVPDGVEVWHENCRRNAQKATGDQLTAIYKWMVSTLGYPVNINFDDGKPEWLDIRRLAQCWMEREGAAGPLEPDTTVDDYVWWLREETGWPLPLFEAALAGAKEQLETEMGAGS